MSPRAGYAEETIVGQKVPILIKTRPIRSIAAKSSLFVLMLVMWVVGFVLADDIVLEPPKLLTLHSILMLVAGAIARFPTRLLVRPLMLLQGVILETRDGRLNSWFGVAIR